MKNVSKQRVLAAFAFGAAMILLSLVLRPDPAPRAATADSPVTAVPNRAPIPIGDSNNDGVPDWQESFSADVTPTTLGARDYEINNTITDQFAREFFEQYMTADMAANFGETPDELVNRASDTLIGVGEDELYTPADLTISRNTSPSALANYGETVARALVELGCSPETPDNEVFSEAVRQNDPALLEPLACRTETYALFEEALLGMTVPSTVVNEHLDLTNVMLAMHNNLAAFEAVFDDPLLALIRVKRYEDDAIAVIPAVEALYQTLVSNGAQWPNSSPVFAIIANE